MALIFRKDPTNDPRRIEMEKRRIKRLLNGIPVHLSKLVFSPLPVVKPGDEALAPMHELRSRTRTQSDLYAVWLILGRIPDGCVAPLARGATPSGRDGSWLERRRTLSTDSSSLFDSPLRCYATILRPSPEGRGRITRDSGVY